MQELEYKQKLNKPPKFSFSSKQKTMTSTLENPEPKIVENPEPKIVGADQQPPPFMRVTRVVDKRCKWSFRQLGSDEDGNRSWGPWNGATSCRHLIDQLHEHYPNEEAIQKLTDNVLYNLHTGRQTGSHKRRVAAVEWPEGLEIRRLS
jgi:hypothetical protein